ncbi:prepilin-type N-terminal cleavage/methylation domain-containing protein [Stenotrophomonas sp. MYb238]|nr:GspH/FimT family pseudopilin [Stenotrophomonas sp. MYb238]MQP76910.1 prepilin-type N-terminal cleavage/methylation domain-containing protein [Stenotrophomonas sp. MYb238]
MSRRDAGVPPSKGAGFTLIELMVTVAVLAIIATIAVPAMQGLIAANRLSAASTELVTALQLARSEAIRRNAPVMVCASDDGTNCENSTEWSRWIVTGTDNATGNAEVIRDSAVTGDMQVAGPAAGIRFRPTGLLDAQAAVTLCLPVSNPSSNQRVVTMMVGGGVATSKQSGNGGCS